MKVASTLSFIPVKAFAVSLALIVAWLPYSSRWISLCEDGLPGEFGVWLAMIGVMEGCERRAVLQFFRGVI